MFRLLKLEERIVLDGAGIMDAMDFLDGMDDLDQEAANAHADGDHDGDGGVDPHEPLGGQALDESAEEGGLHVLVVSSAVEDADGLSNAAKDGVVVIQYDADDTDLDALTGLIKSALKGQKADSIAIAAHNGDGAEVQLTSNDVASIDTLQHNEAQQGFWRSLGASLADGGRIDLLSCDVAGGDHGEDFLAELEGLTRANVAASIDATGNEAFGGDWVLESDEVDIQSTYFEAQRLESFEGTLYEGQDPDPGYNDIFDRTVSSGKYTFISVPTDTWQDEEGTTSVSLSFDITGDNFLRYNASSEGFWALKPAAGESATVNITASDGETPVNTVTDSFTVTAYANLSAPPTFPSIDTVFQVSEDATGGTVVPEAGYTLATDADGTIVDYEIVSGNPTNGSSQAFAIDANGDIVVNDGSLINFNDPYAVNNTHQLVLRAEDSDGIYAFSTVNIEMLEGDLDFTVDLNVSPVTLEEDPLGANTAQITVNISPAPTAPVTINLDIQGSGAEPATGPGTAPTDDYSVTAQTLEFTAGEASKTVTLTVADDTDDGEPNETFTVDIDPTGLDSKYTVAAGTLTELTIIDGAKPVVGLELADATFPESGSTVVTVSLTGGTLASDVRVPLDFAGTAVRGDVADPGVNDYTTANTFVTIPAGDSSITVPLVGVVDNDPENGGSEDFTVSIIDDAANPFNIDPGAASVSGEIVDVVVELPTVRLTSNRAAFAEGETFQITAFLEDDGGAPFFAPADGINVLLDTSGGTADEGDDFIVPSVISIPEGFSSFSATVFGVADGTVEGNETVGVAVGANPSAYNVGSSPFTVVLQDVIDPVVTLNLDGASLITEDPVGTTVVQAVQNTAVATPTTVTIGISGTPAADLGDDYTATYTDGGAAVNTNVDGDWTVVIKAGKTQAGIRITAIQDGQFDGEVNEQIVLTVQSAGTSLVGLPDTATVEIDDADAGDIPVVSLYVEDGATLVNSGELDEAPGTLMEGAVALAPGESPVVPVTVYLTPSDLAGEAQSGTDFGLFDDAAGSTPIDMVDVNGTMAWPVTIANGFNKANFWVGGLGDDDVFEGTENFQLSIFDIVNGTAGADDTISGAINDSTPAPAITLGLSPASVSEPAGGNDTAALSIDLAAVGGTTFGTGQATVTLEQIGNAGFTAATEDVDYALFEADGTTPVAYNSTAGTWTVTVDLNGGTAAAGTFTLKGLPDEAVEGTEGFQLEGEVASTGGASTGTVDGTVIDAAAADPLNVTLETVTPTTVTEGGSSQVNLSLDRVYNADLTVTLTFDGDADENDFFLEFQDGTTSPVNVAGTTLSYDFLIPDGSGTQAGFAIRAVSDGVFEPNEDLGIQITGISADIPPNDFTTNVETVTIVDGLPEPEVTLYWKDGVGNPTTAADLLEPTTKWLYAGISTPVNDDVLVSLDYTDAGATFGVDYSGLATITIDAGQTEGRTLVSVLQDEIFEPDNELFEVSITDVTGPAANAEADLVTGTILPSDLDGAVQVHLDWATAAGNDAQFTEGETGNDSVVIKLDRNTAETTLGVTLQFSAATTLGDAEFGADYDSGVTIDGAGQVSVSIAPGDTQAVLPITAFEDSLVEGNESFNVTIANLSGGEVAGNVAEELGGAGAQELSAVILDTTDAPEISLELVSATTLIDEEGGIPGAAQFRAVITNAVSFSEDITVDIGVIDGTGPGEAQLGGIDADFNVSPPGQQLTISAGETSSGVLGGTGVFQVVPIFDSTFEGDEDLGIRALTAEAVSGVTFAVDTSVQTVTIVDDDPLPTVSLTPATNAVVEDSGATSIVTLTLNGASFDDVPVTLLYNFDGTGGIDTDFDLFVGGDTVGAVDLSGGNLFTYTFSDGTPASVTIGIAATSDTVVEGDENVELSIFSVGNNTATIGANDQSTVTITDDDLDLFVGLGLRDTLAGVTSPASEITEDQTTSPSFGFLDVSLFDDTGAPEAAPFGFPVTATLAASPTTGLGDYEIFRDFAFTDQVALSSTGTFDVTVPAGVDFTRLYIRGVDDGIFEGTEPFSVTAVDADIAEVSAGVADILVTGLVIDNDAPPALSISAATPSVTEGGTAEFSLSFEDPSSVETVVSFTVGGDATFPADFTGPLFEIAGGGNTYAFDFTGGVLTFTLPAEDVESLGAFTIRAFTKDDGFFEQDEDIVLTLQDGTDYTLGTDTEAAVTIADNDDAPIVSLGTASTAPITEDNTGDPTTTISIDLSTSSGSDTVVTLEFQGTATPATANPATVPPDDYTVSVGGTAATFGTAPYTLEVTIPAGDTSAVLTLSAIDDGLFEGDEDVVVSIVDAEGATPTTADAGINETVVITDVNTPPDVTLFWQSGGGAGTDGAFNENSGSDVLIAQISEAVGLDATIALNFTGGADYSPGLTFPPDAALEEDVTDLNLNTAEIVISAGATQGFVTFYGLEDDLYEADTINGVSGEDFVASIAAVTFGDDIPGGTGAIATATAVIIDAPEDVPTVSLSVADTSVTEGNSTTFTVIRDTDPGVTTTVNLVFTTTMGDDWVDDGDFTVGGTGFVSGPTSFSISVDIVPDQTFATVSFDAAGTDGFEANEQVTVELVPVENGVASTVPAEVNATVTIIDDGNDTAVLTFNNQAAGGTVGDTDFAEVAFNTIPNTATFTVELDSGVFDARTITLQATGAGEPGVDYTIEVDADGTVGATYGFETVTVAADGSFSFTLDAGITAAEVRLTGQDDTGYESPESVVLSVADSAGLSVGAVDTLTYTLFDDDLPPEVNLSVTVDEIEENGGATSLFVLLTDSSGAAFTAETDVTVTLDFGGQATSGGTDPDFAPTLETVVIQAGNQKSEPIFLESFDDLVYEGNETIVVSAISANITNAVEGTNNVATVTILEDETGPTVGLSVNTTTIPEANGEAALTFDLSFTSPVEEIVYLDFTTTEDNSVGTSQPNGLWDWTSEARYADNVDLWPNDYLATDASGFVTGGGADLPNGTELAIVTNPNTGLPALEVAIPQGDPSYTVYLHALNDNATFVGDQFLFEKDESFTVSIDADSFDNNLTADPAANAATVTIEDDDTPPAVDLAWGLGSGSYTESAGSNTGNFTVSLDSATNQFVQVVLALEGQPEDYTINFGAIAGATAADNGDGTITLTFQTNAGTQAATVPFTIEDDNVYEIEENFTLSIQEVIFATAGVNDTLGMTITDDGDQPQITVGVDVDGDNIPDATTSVLEGDSIESNLQFIIDKDDVETPQPVLVDYVISSGTAAGEAEAGVDFTAVTSGTVTLARNADAIAIVDLTVLPDDLDEGAGEDVVITISNARFQDGTPLTGSISAAPDDAAVLTIEDDDASPTVGVNAGVTVTEGDFVGITDAELFYNDADTTGGAVTVSGDLIYNVVTAPANGTLYLGVADDVTISAPLGPDDVFFQDDLADGSLWYQHDDSETTSDEFTYVVSDKVLTDPEANTQTGTFDITVIGENDPPEAESIIFWIDENTTGEVSDLFDLTGDGVLVIDPDIGDTLTANITIGDGSIFSLDTSNPGEVRLNVDAPLDYEAQNAYALSVNVTDAAGESIDVLAVVNVKDDVSETNDGFPAGTIPTPDPIVSDSQWTFRIPDEVFPDGELVTYKFVETGGGNTSPWLNFASEAQTFWYHPAINPGPEADQTYNIQVTATYWHQNEVIKGVSQADFVLDYVASLEVSDQMLEALDFLEEGEADGFFLPEEGDGIEIQEMMVALAAPAEGAEVGGEVSAEQAEMDSDSELNEVLALLDEGAMVAEFGALNRTA